MSDADQRRIEQETGTCREVYARRRSGRDVRAALGRMSDEELHELRIALDRVAAAIDGILGGGRA